MIDSLSVIPQTLKRGGAAFIAECDRVMLGRPSEMASKWVQTEIDREGSITLRYTEAFAAASDASKAEMLEHEAGHFADETFTRCQDRDKMLWNVATDCAINHHLDRHLLPADGCFYDSYGFPPAPAEIVYEWLKQGKGNGAGSGCGHLTVEVDPSMLSPELLRKLIHVAASVEEERGKSGKHAGSCPGGGGDVGVLPTVDYPPWMHEVEKVLRKYVSLARRRTWMREPRREVYTRGRWRKKSLRELGGLILLDVSGSMWEDLPRLLAVVQHYLPKAEGAVWDTVASQRMPASRLVNATRSVGGGGTKPVCAEGLRRPGEITLWISDCEVETWPVMTQDDVVLRTGGGQAPVGIRVIKACEE